MEKGRKMRRYSRKDYTQLVDFPVEIVGRDGVVRRYSFEESVRLYQRRIASASLRYHDEEVVDAEVRHCSSRIEQLRRSYFTRYGWSGIHLMGTPGSQGPGKGSGFAAEVAAFLRRWLEASDFDPESLEFSFLEESSYHQVYFVKRPRLEGTTAPDLGSDHLLYLFRFEQAGTCASRDEFFRFLKVLQGVRGAASGVESLISFHHTADCGLVLTGQGNSGVTKEPVVEQAGAQVPEVELGWTESDRATDPLRRAMTQLRHGDRDAALESFAEAYEKNHFRRAAYIGAAVVADQLGEHLEAETAALMGGHYFPDDPVIHYHLAVARLRRGDLAEARASLQRVAELDALPGNGALATGLVGALITLAEGHTWRGRQELLALSDVVDPADADLQRARQAVLGRLRVRDVLVLSSLFFGVLGGILGLWMGPWSLPLVGLGVGTAGIVHLSWSRGFAALIRQPGGEGLRLANPGVLKRLGEAATREQ